MSPIDNAAPATRTSEPTVEEIKAAVRNLCDAYRDGTDLNDLRDELGIVLALNNSMEEALALLPDMLATLERLAGEIPDDANVRELLAQLRGGDA